jgi:hypothetical protein
MRVAHGSAVGLDQLGGRIIAFWKMGKAAGWFGGGLWLKPYNKLIALMLAEPAIF